VGEAYLIQELMEVPGFTVPQNPHYVLVKRVYSELERVKTYLKPFYANFLNNLASGTDLCRGKGQRLGADDHLIYTHVLLHFVRVTSRSIKATLNTSPLQMGCVVSAIAVRGDCTYPLRVGPSDMPVTLFQ